ncbi:hypothetical protein [Candidatus Poriferisodalis sp.]|uniref:hypothetical protein n=1 Tax=Candidatus Poriferisodalis sp. TaxID=3101277 RepID=UPI003B010161
MSTRLAVGLAELPDGFAVTVEKNRWRRLWAVMCIGTAAIAIAGGVLAAVTASSAECSRYSTDCAADQALAALPWMIASGSAMSWAVILFGIWWATRQYRPVTHRADA